MLIWVDMEERCAMGLVDLQMVSVMGWIDLWVQ